MTLTKTTARSSDAYEKLSIWRKSPTVSIVEFTDDSILGAYIMGQGRIFIDENILHSRSLDRVLLEEFGHWLEDGLDDSEGDEGDTFARSLLGLNTRDTPSEINKLYQFVELDGQLLKAEFSQETRRSAFKEVLERLDDLESHDREFTSAFEMLLHRVEELEEKDLEKTKTIQDTFKRIEDIENAAENII